MKRKYKLVSYILFTTLLVSFVIIFLLARGYQFNFRERQIEGTGILVANSTPQGARVYLNGESRNATNTSISGLEPGKHQVKIVKEGFHEWKKGITIKQELVTEVNALLTPLYPQFKPLTFTGVEVPLISPDGQKIIYSATSSGKSALWILDLNERPFDLSPRPRQLIENKSVNYSLAQKTWSPDSQFVLLEFPSGKDISPSPSPTTAQQTDEGTTLLLDTNNKSLKNVANPDNLKTKWQEETQTEEEKWLQDLSPEMQELIRKIDNPRWSPDHSYILYHTTTEQQTLHKIVSLDSSPIQQSPTKQPTVTPAKEITILQTPKDNYTRLIWYPDSLHLFVLEKNNKEAAEGTLSLIEVDGDNRHRFFSGIIKNNHVFPFTNGSKVAILTTFNSRGETYNLYSIGLQ